MVVHVVFDAHFVSLENSDRISSFECAASGMISDNLQEDHRVINMESLILNAPREDGRNRREQVEKKGIVYFVGNNKEQASWQSR